MNLSKLLLILLFISTVHFNNSAQVIPEKRKVSLKAALKHGPILISAIIGTALIGWLSIAKYKNMWPFFQETIFEKRRRLSLSLRQHYEKRTENKPIGSPGQVTLARIEETWSIAGQSWHS